MVRPGEPDDRDHSHLIAHQIMPPAHRTTLPESVPAWCTARSYGGEIVTVEGTVTKRSGDHLRFDADYPDWGWWVAWVHRDTCEPIDPA
jgi:hypothetical protein